jgi:hypothetical protein
MAKIKLTKKMKQQIKRDAMGVKFESSHKKSSITWNIEEGDLVKLPAGGIALVIEKRAYQKVTSYRVLVDTQDLIWIDAAKLRKV